MSQEITITVYRSVELTGAARERALTWIGEGVTSFAAGDVTEHIKARLEPLGLPVGDIQWSLSSCQGDGVAFYGPIDLPRFIRTIYGRGRVRREQRYALGRAIFDGVGVKIIRNHLGHRYSHARTMVVETDYRDDNPAVEDALEQFVEDATSFIRTLSNECEHAGYSILEAATDPEALDEHADANGFLFHEDGRPV